MLIGISVNPCWFQMALRVRARRTFNDVTGVRRQSGEEWLVTYQDTRCYPLDENVEVAIGYEDMVHLSSSQYCVVISPGEMAQKQVIVGPLDFYLLPGTRLDNEIQDDHRQVRRFTEEGTADTSVSV